MFARKEYQSAKVNSREKKKSQQKTKLHHIICYREKLNAWWNESTS